MSADR
jgi:hypothetical protein